MWAKLFLYHFICQMRIALEVFSFLHSLLVFVAVVAGDYGRCPTHWRMPIAVAAVELSNGWHASGCMRTKEEININNNDNRKKTRALLIDEEETCASDPITSPFLLMVLWCKSLRISEYIALATFTPFRCYSDSRHRQTAILSNEQITN